ncbi:nucleotidyltransferase family protein [Pectinatus haikarae]|uniref:nucleotidyltransferase family protein n=1 Tax=Pectinatus haikarae TaxID=349096 RepID=UPI0018C6A584|nr:nucleotidyltransferase family protein [Pectinatus haikarae]
METIILAGGFGTRLQRTIKNIPKSMARVNNKPFLEYIIKNLINNGIDKIILAVGYKKENIMGYFGTSYQNIPIDYSMEEEPLLTGGAIKKALNMTTEKDVFIVNGDTFFDIDFSAMIDLHSKKNADLTIAVKKMKNFDRYGTIEIKDYRIIKFNEKKYCELGIINGGIYCMKRTCLNEIEKKSFSIERGYMEGNCKKKYFYAFESDKYFIDIGIPEDYYKAQIDFKSIFKGTTI